MSSFTLELAICVFPFGARRDRFDRVPVFGNLAILNTEEIVKRARLPCELTLAGNQHEIPFTQHLMDLVLLHGDPGLGHCLERGTQAGQAVGNLRVVLVVVVAIVVAGQAI